MKIETHPIPGGGFADVTRLLGGDATLHKTVSTSMEAHDLIADGLPASALRHLLDGLEILDRTSSLEKVVGMSLRTFQRRRDESGGSLSPELSGRAWKFAEVLARAIAVFGSRAEAETWLDRPARGLDGRRPIDLLATPAGTEIVETLLEQIDRGVYV